MTETSRTGVGPAASRLVVLGVVLAAGKASRMDGSKVTRTVAGTPMVRRVVEAALASRLARVVVVVGNEAAAVRTILRDHPVRIVDNPAFERGLSTSVHAALRAAGTDCAAALFLLSDQPFVTGELIDRLIEAFVASGRPIVRPELDGRPANPVLFSARLFPELLRESGDRGGRRVIERHQEEISYVTVEDPLLCRDIDTFEEYAELGDG